MTQTKVLLIVAGLSMTGQAFAGNDAELRADSANRTSFSAAAGAGWDKNFWISDGGNNSLHVGGTTQFRYNVSVRDDSVVGDQDDFTHGFNSPTNRLRFWGTIWDKALGYKIEGNFSSENPGGGTFTLEDAYGTYDFGNNFVLGWGQWKLPLNRADIVDNEYQLSADRSIASAAFSGGYVQGIKGVYTTEMVKVSGSFHDGQRNLPSILTNSQNTDFTSSLEADYALGLRVDVQAMGNDWNRWNDYTSWKSAKDNGLLIGGAINWQSGGETGGTADADALNYTLDISFEGQGWNIYGAFYGSRLDFGGGSEFDNFGGEIGGGFFFNDQFEVFARWDGLFLDDDAFGGDTDIHFATLGMNYYLSPESHAAKFTGQFSYAFNETSNVFGASGMVGDTTRYGYLGQSDDGEWAITLQMQVMF
jgi:hypothetical protein